MEANLHAGDDEMHRLTASLYVVVKYLLLAGAENAVLTIHGTLGFGDGLCSSTSISSTPST